MRRPDLPATNASPQAEARLAAALAEAAAIVNSALEFEEVLDQILEQVTRVVPGDTYNIMLVDNRLARIVRWRGYEERGIPDHKVRETVTSVSSYDTFRQMMLSGEPVVVADTVANGNWTSKPHRVDHRSYLGAPIRIEDRTEGFININSSAPDRFTADHAERLRAFANHAAAALRNARLYREVQHHAEELEQRVEARTIELEARTAWSEAILRSTSDGIIVTDGAGEIVQMNPVARAWLEQSLEPNDAQRLRSAVRAVAQQAAESPELLLDLSGINLALHASLISATNPTGSAVVAVHDVTHLRALDRMKSQFISDVSHELRTPITALTLYTSLLRNSSEDRREAYFASLEDELGRLSRLVQGILHIARIEAGHLELRPRAVDLDLLAATAVASFESEADGRGLEIAYVGPGHPVLISADPTWMIRAVNNLIENALLYTHTGTVTVTVSADADGVHRRPTANLIVADTGIGIPVNEIDHLFERFFRTEEARTLQVPGSGLGLAIVKGVVAVHGGTIEVDSEAGAGSRFTVQLPLSDASV